MNRLKEIHDLVKLHSYRRTLDKKDWDEYSHLLYKLGDLFYDEIKDTQYKSSSIMVHDLFGSIRRNPDNQTIRYIENCIGVIHEFIDTGKVLKFQTYYTGSNKLQNSPRIHNFVWTGDKYKLNLPKEVAQLCVDEILEWRRLHPKYTSEYLKYSIYSDSQLELFRSLTK